MPQYVDELFELAGKAPQDFFRYQRLDIICKYFYEDGSRLTAFFADERKFINEFSNHTNETPETIKRYRRNSEKIYNLTDPIFLQKSLHQLKTYLSADALKALFSFSKIDAFRNMHQASSVLFRDKRLIQYADRFCHRIMAPILTRHRQH